MNTAKGFTLAELVVAMAIIAILSAIIVPTYASRARELGLERSTNLVAQFVHTAIERSLSASELTLAGNIIPAGGYGIHFAGDGTVFLFADCNADAVYSIGNTCVGSPEQLEPVQLEQGVAIGNLSPGDPLDIVFRPPDPVVYVNGAISQIAQVRLVLSAEPSKSRKLIIYPTGLVEITL